MQLPPINTQLTVAGLSSCTDSPDQSIAFNKDFPITVLVHGCDGSAGRFRALAELYAFHGQQAVCFSYDDRDSLKSSAEKLTHSLNQLAAHVDNKNLNIIGHSMGGLVSRKALEETNNHAGQLSNKEVRLVTVSAPLSGISAADHCASETVNWLSLGIVPAICWAVTGSNWSEIVYSSSFIQQPKPLIPSINQYLKIVTDERDTCRKYDDNGLCLESDYVFDLAEQYNPKIDNDPIVTNVQVNAGHVGIVGNSQLVPRQLISVLKQYKVLAQTPEQRIPAFEALLARLYQ